MQVVLQPFPSYKLGILGKGNINFNGNNVLIDSYDSSNPAKSTGGQYDVAKRQNNGDVATNGVELNAGGADIYGSLYVGVNGSITNNAGFYQPSDETKTVGFQVDIPNPVLNWSPPGGAALSLDATHSSSTVVGGDYTISSISVAGNNSVIIDATTTTVRLYVTGDISVVGNGSISIIGTHSVEVWFLGNVSLGGNGITVPANYIPANVKFIGMAPAAGVTKTVSDVGNGQFTGSIYAPGHNISIAGNGIINGAIVGNNITMVGNATMHYDEAINNTVVTAGYQTMLWSEVNP